MSESIYHELEHPRKITEIVQGEVAAYGSSDNGTTWHPIKLDSDGKLIVTT